MALIRVTASELRTKAAELRELNSQFNTQVNNLDNQEQSLMGMWEGEAKTAFDGAFKRDKTQMDNFKRLMDDYCTTLENIAIKYENAEAQNAEIAGTRSY